jgi:hypothetical protein
MWLERFNNKIEKFSTCENNDARGWSCCAVGSRIQLERPELIENITNKRIMLRKLLTPRAYYLGVKFYDAVTVNNVEKAEKIFNKIQSLDNIYRNPMIPYYPWSKYFD